MNPFVRSLLKVLERVGAQLLQYLEAHPEVVETIVDEGVARLLTWLASLKAQRTGSSARVASESARTGALTNSWHERTAPPPDLPPPAGNPPLLRKG